MRKEEKMETPSAKELFLVRMSTMGRDEVWDIKNVWQESVDLADDIRDAEFERRYNLHIKFDADVERLFTTQPCPQNPTQPPEKR